MTDEERQELCNDLRLYIPTHSRFSQAAAELERLGRVIENMGDEIERLAALAQSDAEPVRAFAKAVLHGDDEHKAWLTEAAEAFITGKPLPAPRGKGAKQSNAEPVAWRWRYPHGGWAVHTSKPCGAEDCIVEPLYATTPRPDASDAGWTSRQSYSELKGWHWVDDLSANPPGPAQSDADEFGRGYQAGWQDREARDPLGANRTSLPPDASAELIEAAEIVYAKWDKLSDSDPKACGDMWELYNELRARAADRSSKKMTDTQSWHKPHTAPKDRPFLAWCPGLTIPFTVVEWSNEFKNFTRIDTRGLTANFAFWMELPQGPHGDRGGK